MRPGIEGLTKVKVARMLGVALVSAAIVWLFVDTVPPSAMTHTRVTITERRLRAFVRANGHLPAKLADLPEVPANQDGELHDAWGRPIQYTVSGSNVTLKSLGKDGLEGGIGENVDIVRKVTFDE